MKHEIKAGDRVICNDDSSSFRRLQNGMEYQADLAYDQETVVVTVNGAYHNIDRFKIKEDN